MNGVIEKQDKFLKRMSGFIRLYAAVMTSSLPQGPQHTHPHGMEQAWLWLTRTMNLPPVIDVTATLMYDMLQVTGFALWKTYGKQFEKLLTLLISDFLPKIRQVKSTGGGGPVTRLENYLQKCIQSGSIPPPEGLLSQNFWYT